MWSTKQKMMNDVFILSVFVVVCNMYKFSFHFIMLRNIYP